MKISLRLTCPVLFLLSASLVLGGSHNQSKVPAIAKDQALTAEIDAFLNEYEALWDKQDPAGLIALWDQGDDEPFYLAEEQNEWRIGWQQVMNYWDAPGPSSANSVRMRFDGVQARWLSEELAFAKFWIRFDTSMKFMPAPIGTDARASAVLRKTDDGWRLVTWAESPGSPILYIANLYKLHREEGEESPIPYITTLYERHTRPDFAEYMKTHSTAAAAE
jgi:hypothetical protein